MSQILAGKIVVLDPNGVEAPISGVEVSLSRKDGPEVVRMLSDDEGRLEAALAEGPWELLLPRLSTLPTGDKAILVGGPTRLPLDVEADTEIRLPEKFSYSLIPDDARVAGVVTCLLGTHLREHAKLEPLSGVAIRLVSSDSDAAAETVSDVHGVFVFRGLSEGRYGLKVPEVLELTGTHAGLPCGLTQEGFVPEVTVSNGEVVVRDVPYRAREPAIVTGQMLLKETLKSPVTGIDVELYSRAHSQSERDPKPVYRATSDTQGCFEIVVYPDQYRLEVPAGVKIGDSDYVLDGDRSMSFTAEEGRRIELRPILYVDREREKGTKRLGRFLATMTTRRASEWILLAVSVFVALVLGAGLAWVCWVEGIPSVYDWGFGFGDEEWRWIDIWKMPVAVFGIFYLAIIPLVVIPAFKWMWEAWDEYFNETLSQEIHSARSAQKRIEEELLKRDPDQITKVVAYSRETLREYYTIGRNQAQRSFRYSVIAMWLGFFVLLFGVVDTMLPISGIMLSAIQGYTAQQREQSEDAEARQGLTRSGSDARPEPAGQPVGADEAVASKIEPSSGVDPGAARSTAAEIERAVEQADTGQPDSANQIVLLTGAVIEFIAAVFLWVYRYSIRQLTFFYSRQLRFHNVLLAQRLTGGMGDKKDEAIKAIIEKLFDESQQNEIEAPSGRGIGRFLKGGA